MEADKQQRLLPLIRWVHRALVLIGVVFAAAGKVPKSGAHELTLRVVAIAEAHQFWVVPLVLLALPATEWIRRRFETRTTWRTVEAVLAELRDQVFPGKGDPSHHHRVTLFRRKKLAWVARCWPWSGWMVPVARSCHTTRKSGAIFAAPDDADLARGIAGVAWTLPRDMMVQENLPNLALNPSSHDLADYATRSFVDLDTVRKKPPLSRSLCGIPIRVKGVVWGALVIDSRAPTLDMALINQHYKGMAAVLSKLLEAV